MIPQQCIWQRLGACRSRQVCQPTLLRWVILTLPLAFWSVFLPAMAKAQSGTERVVAMQDAIELSPEDSKAVKSIRNSRWFDPQKGAFRPPASSGDPDHPLRTNGRIAAPTAKKAKTNNAAPAAGGAAATGLTPAVIFWPATIFLVIAVIATLVILGLMSMRNSGRIRSAKPTQSKSIEIDPNKIVDLPFESTTVSSDPLAQARAFMASGKYDQATLFLYGYILLALDQSGRIQLHRGKTNRMYLRELASNRQLRLFVESVMLGFEDVFFGRHAISEDRYMSFWNQLDAFHATLAQPHAESMASTTPTSLAVPS